MDKEFAPVKDESKENTFVDCLESNEEKISQSFVCCVCLDLLYKPIVLACGHVSCFWCVHKSMNSFGESNCPVCRNSYHHFPTICQMLHFLIIKMYPSAYQRRDDQILEEEKAIGFNSPQFEASSLRSDSPCGSASLSVSCSKSNSPSVFLKLKKPECFQDVGMVVTEENNQSQPKCNGSLNEISITDVLCPTCRKLLFRPAVLNCGHAFCETCIAVPEDEIIICPTCENPHPSDFPKVCIELNNFLEETFPNEYAARRDSIERIRAEFLQKEKSPPGSSCSKKSDGKSPFPDRDLLRWLTEHGPKVHIGIGCDYCGIFPILGNRYRCEDCTETVGFDLCGECYNTQSKLPGRFNQQHTAEHKFELIKNSEMARRLLLRLVTGNFEEPMVLSTDVSEDSDDGPVTIEYSNDSEENADNDEDQSAELDNNSTGDESNNIQLHP